jgi:hypothetical protein
MDIGFAFALDLALSVNKASHALVIVVGLRAKPDLGDKC